MFRHDERNFIGRPGDLLIVNRTHTFTLFGRPDMKG